MNPTLPADYLERMAEEDPEAYRSEVLGEFRSGVSTLLDPENLNQCVVPSRRELPPVQGIRYVAFTDPASGGGKDSFTLCVGHRDGERCVVDLLRAWKPPFNPQAIVAEASDVLRSYRCGNVVGDSGEFVWSRFRECGIQYQGPRLTERQVAAPSPGLAQRSSPASISASQRRSCRWTAGHHSRNGASTRSSGG